jgi:hypothetical protein
MRRLAGVKMMKGRWIPQAATYLMSLPLLPQAPSNAKPIATASKTVGPECPRGATPGLCAFFAAGDLDRRVLGRGGSAQDSQVGPPSELAQCTLPSASSIAAMLYARVRRSLVSPHRRGRLLRRLGVLAAAASAFCLAGLVQSAPALAAPDFQITVAPTSQTLPPGQSVSFRVGVGAVEGFSEPVSLSVAGLPEEVTATFSVNPVNPSGFALLTLTASEAVPTGTSSVTVIGTGGGITHEATGEVRVNFGLVPICYGAAEGVVTDRETGFPLANVQIVSSGTVLATTNVLGHYRVEQVDLGPNNSAREYSPAARKAGYFEATQSAIAVCDQTNEINFQLTRIRPAVVSGRAVVGHPDPSDHSVVIPTSTPIEGARVAIPSVAGTQEPTEPDGLFSFEVTLGDGDHPNQPADYFMQATVDAPYREGYWDRFVSVHLEPGPNPPAEIALVKQCTGSISGTVMDGDTGLPASGIAVHISNSFDGDDVLTNAQGEFSSPTLLLGRNNAPTTYGVGAQPEGYEFAAANAPLATCGAHQEVELVLRRAPRPRSAAVEGHVYDEETGAPVAGVQVSLPFACPCDITDADGHYRLTEISLGQNATGETSIRAEHSDYWRADSDLIELRADETSTADLRVLRKRFAGVAGVVRDAITKEVIADAAVGIDSGLGDLSDEAGRYSIAGVELGHRNAPRDVQVRAGAQGYWPKEVLTGVRADETSTHDFELLPVCRGATITGRVVSAVTGGPIEGASVFGGGREAVTDVNGDYRLEGVAVGVENEPLQVDLTASASGFFSQTKRIIVFCGARIVVDFGTTSPDTAAIEGYVTNATTGTPIADVFVGSEFGGSARTDEQGYYRLSNAPLTPDGSPRSWDVTASPGGFDPQTKPVTVRANETARLDFAFGAEDPATIIVKQRTRPSANPQAFSFATDYGASFSLMDGESNESAPLTPADDYSVTQALPPGWDLESATCSDGSPIDAIDITAGETVTCTFINRQRGKIIVKKQTNPAISTHRFDFSTSYDHDGFSLGNGEQNDSGFLVPGTYSVSEVVPTGWDKTSATCDDQSDPATISLAAGETVTCTFVNTQRGTAKVVKTVTGAALVGSHAFRFQLRQNASPTQDGTILETLAANAVNGGIVEFTTLLQPGDTYQMCETVMPGWSSTLGNFVPQSFIPPDGIAPNPNVDNSIVCVNFTVAAGATRIFNVDNTPPPGGRALTIGFWKNWAACSTSSGKQKPELDRVMATFPIAAGQTKPGVYIGRLYVDTCQEAVALLNKSDLVTANKMSSDPLYSLAAQLMATELNFRAGAGKCGAAITAEQQAQGLLTRYSFTGTGSYVKKLSAADSQLANQLAKTLDNYNNDRLC